MSGDDWTARLPAVLAEVVLVLVVEGSAFDPRRRRDHRLLARVEDPAAMSQLRTALECSLDGKGVRWMMEGRPTIALYGAERLFLGAVSLLGSDFVRLASDDGDDARLRQPTLMAEWLERQGIPASGE